jgi:hypothetical protein
LLKKAGAVAAILFCIGVAISPGLSSGIVSASSERDSVEVSIEVCGIKGYRPSTVTLPKSHYEIITEYLQDLMKRLNTTSSRNDAVLLVHEAVVELDTYGLLPRGTSVSEVQILVSGSNQNSLKSALFKNKILSKWNEEEFGITYPSLMNLFCVLSATATKIPGYSPKSVIIPLSVLLVFALFPALIVSLFGQELLANRLAELGLSLWMLNPLRFSNFVVFQGYDVEFQSLGLKGQVHGTLHKSIAFGGFTGLMISLSKNTTYFLGSAYSIYGLS